MNHELRLLIEIYLNRFCNRWDVYAKQFVKGHDFQYFPVKARMSPEIIYACLCGFFGMGFYALSAEGLGRWLAFDSDTTDGQLKKLANWLRAHGWHVLEEGARPGKDGHAWVLFDEPVDGKTLQTLGNAMLKQSGTVVKEIFPKQDRPLKVGSLVRAPLSCHFKPGADGCRGWFAGCPEKDIRSQLIWLSKQPLNSAKVAQRQAYEHRPMPKPIYLNRKPKERKLEQEALEHEVTALLKIIDPNLPYPAWLRTGIFIHASGLGFALWNSWSAGGSEYDAELCEEKWSTFGKKKLPPEKQLTIGDTKKKKLTIASLYHFAKEYPNLRYLDSLLNGTSSVTQQKGTTGSAK